MSSNKKNVLAFFVRLVFHFTFSFVFLRFCITGITALDLRKLLVPHTVHVDHTPSTFTPCSKASGPETQNFY